MLGEGGRAPKVLNLNIHNYEQRQCDQFVGTSGFVFMSATPPPHFSSHHWFSLRTYEGEKKRH